MSFSLTGKTAIVTGAANGLGLAIARHFIERGAQVVAADIDEARLQAEFGKSAPGDGPLRLFAGDLRHRLCRANLLSTAHDAFARIDILVNAARIVETGDPLRPEEDRVETLMQANLLPLLRLSQAVAQRMIAQGGEPGGAPGGAIVNLSSLAARRARSELMGFALAAGAVEQVTRALALALAPHQIRVNALAVGSVMTASLQARLKDDPARRQDLIAATPLGRIASAREAAETVQFLASDAAGFMTGQVLVLDGGRSIQEPPASACV